MPSADRSSTTTRVIAAPCERVYHAFIDPQALQTWLAPGDWTARVIESDVRIGGSYTMAIAPPVTDAEYAAKSSGREDRYTARFEELTPPRRIVETITFDTTDPAFMGEMTLTVTLNEQGESTAVTMAFENLPPGVSPADNDLGTRLSLEKLANLVE
jgi:uncharacterized protein YndB with AHSA1/START domain